MPIIKSAKKRVKVAAKANARNTKTRRQVRETIKAYTKALESGKADKITEAQRAAFSALDSAAKKAVMHKNKAARKKAQLSKMAKDKGVKPQKAVAKKAALAKKPTAKKTSKKPAAKKPSPEK